MKSTKPVFIFSLIASILVFYVFNRIALVFEGLSGNLFENINAAIDGILPAIRAEPFLIGTNKTCLIAGLIGATAVWLIFIYNVFGSKKFMKGEEHGTVGDKKGY